MSEKEEFKISTGVHAVRTPRFTSSLMFHYFKIYWKTIFNFMYPLILLPIILINDTPPSKCAYIVLLMAGYWVFESVPLPVTSLIPMVLMPLMSILDSDKVSQCYMKETNMMFIGGLIIAIAIEHCKLHTRIALYTIKLIGCSPRRLNIGLCFVTMFVSMWISNTAATAMMIPIVEATLTALQDQGVGHMYEEVEDAEGKEENEKKPTKTTMCYFISTAYAASIGGTGCIIGSGTNLAFKGLYETQFPESPGVEFTKWMALNVPLMLVIMICAIIFLQFWFMGLFRPNSEDAKKIKIGKQGEEVAKKLINRQLEEMGPITFHETMVALMFILAILLWFFRKPQVITGWAELLTDFKVKDATPAIMVSLLIFILPSNYDFIYMFSKDESKRPKAPASPLVTWKIVQQKMPWGLIFLMGGGFAIADASKASGMSAVVAEKLRIVTNLHKIYIMIISGLLGAFLTQFSSNVAVANVILPVLSEVAVKAQIHPMYIMMPAALCCSYAYCLPVSTPPNAIAAAPCNMKTWEMVKVGIGLTIVSLLCLFLIFPFLAPVIWDMAFPSWVHQ